MSESEPEEIERRAGDGVRRARQAVGMSQERLAELMRRRGYAMSQPVIGKIERGERPLRLAEGVSIASALGVPLPELVGEQYDAGERQGLVDQAKHELLEEFRSFMEAS